MHIKKKNDLLASHKLEKLHGIYEKLKSLVFLFRYSLSLHLFSWWV